LQIAVAFEKQASVLNEGGGFHGSVLARCRHCWLRAAPALLAVLLQGAGISVPAEQSVPVNVNLEALRSQCHEEWKIGGEAETDRRMHTDPGEAWPNPSHV